MATSPMVTSPRPEQIKLIRQLEAKCCAVLEGHKANIQGAVLICLIARHIAGLPPDVRAKLTAALFKNAAAMGVHYAKAVDKAGAH